MKSTLGEKGGKYNWVGVKVCLHVRQEPSDLAVALVQSFISF